MANADWLVLQFHITGRCNLQCKHCYRTDGGVQPLSFDDVIGTLEQFKALIKRRASETNSAEWGHVNITGGEPFMREDMPLLLEYFEKNKSVLGFGVLTNGSFITEDMIGLLKKAGVSFVQLSLDGNRALHDELRAKGDYRRTLKTAALLEKRGIKTYISFTANRKNIKALPSAAWACRLRGISLLWSDRLVPIGNGADMKELAITREYMPEYLSMLKKAVGTRLTQRLFPKTFVARNRAIQFLGCTDPIYTCSAGNQLITVDEFGNIMPCRRMGTVCGDVFSSSLEEIYCHHPLFLSLRESAVPESCYGCIYNHLCRGGAKCQTLAAYGRLNEADPGCPLSKTGGDL
ncbi:MAG: radical SAM protein [Clostridia bacterium]|nr:radical SAM protein [Clostridia bacterium]